MNMKKIATMATCMALVGAVAVGGTLALMAKEDSITNTFMVGAGFPGGEDGEGKAYFYVDESVVKMNDKNGNWVNVGVKRTHKDQIYGVQTLEQYFGDNKQDADEDGYVDETENWKVVADSTLVKDPKFHVNAVMSGADKAPAAYVVAKLGAIPNGFVPKSVNGTTGWYELEIVTSGDEVTSATLGDPVSNGDTLSADKYYVFMTALKVNGTEETEALFDTVEVGPDVTESNYTLPVYGVAVEVPSENASLTEPETLNEIASAAYTALPKNT